MSTIFLSHSHNDKLFARKLAKELKRHGIKVWIDEAELKIGDSLIERIREGIDQMEYLGVLLSKSSVSSPWVRREVDIAMNQEIKGRRIKVLPVLIENCDLPGFLEGKLYADLRDSANYQEGLKKILDRLGVDLSAPLEDLGTLETLLGAALSRSDGELLTRAMKGFLTLSGPKAAFHGFVRDILGAVVRGASQHEQTREQILDLCAQVVLEGLESPLPAASVAVQYLFYMPKYFKKVPRPIAEAPLSAMQSERIGGALCLFRYGTYADTTEAESVLLDSDSPLALRIASALLLGTAAHVDAVKCLTKAAENIGKEPPDLQKAVVRGLHLVTKHASPVQVLEGLEYAFNSATESGARCFAAKRFLDIVDNDLQEGAQKDYESASQEARVVIQTHEEPNLDYFR